MHIPDLVNYGVGAAIAAIVLKLLWDIIFKFVVKFVTRILDESKEREQALMKHQEKFGDVLEKIVSGQNDLHKDVHAIGEQLTTHIKNHG